MTDLDSLIRARDVVNRELGIDWWEPKPIFSSLGRAGIGKDGQLLVQVKPESEIPPACDKDLVHLLAQSGFRGTRIQYYQTGLDAPEVDY